MSDRLVLVLPHFLRAKLGTGHPWIYRDHVPRGFTAPTGSWVRVESGSWGGYALWDAESSIALRVFSEHQIPDSGWVAERIRIAAGLRASSVGPATTAFRLIAGEGDGLPGITVDVYGDFAVIVTYAQALEPLVPWVIEGLERVRKFKGILKRKRDPEGHALGGLELRAGREPPADLVITENGVRLYVNLALGQKTGLFLDHRDNRALIRGLAQGKRVLNLFAYTGAFSLAAMLGGAAHVTSVDLSAPAIEAARANFKLNGFDPDSCDFLVADVFEYLEAAHQDGRSFDFVICDPPSMAHSKSQLERALRAYVRVNGAGLRLTEESGLYASASCTAQVSIESFRNALAQAARNAKCRLQLIHEAGQAADHPVFAGHPEGRYLKFALGRRIAIA